MYSSFTTLEYDEYQRHRTVRRHNLSVFEWFETDGLISQRRDWLIGSEGLQEVHRHLLHNQTLAG